MITEELKRSVELADLVRDHQAGIWRYLRALGCDPALADDLTQETFLTLVKRPMEYRGEAAAAKYLRMVARSRFISLMRKQGREPKREDLQAVEYQWQKLMPENAGDEALVALRSCLERLPEQARDAIKLRYEAVLSREDCATTLEMSEDGVKSLLRRARTALRRCVETKLSSGDYRA